MIHKEKIYMTYADAEIVGNCVQTMLQEQNALPACPTIFIGYNGKEFVSSSDWKLQTPQGTCILPFGVLPQYPSYIQADAGTGYNPHPSETAVIHPDPLARPRIAVVRMPNGQKFEFQPGSAVKIPVTGKLAERFPLTDCRICMEPRADRVIYTLIPDENTMYGKFNGKNIEEC